MQTGPEGHDPVLLDEVLEPAVHGPSFFGLMIVDEAHHCAGAGLVSLLAQALAPARNMRRADTLRAPA